MKKIARKAISYLLVTSFILSSVSIMASAERPRKNDHMYKTTQIIVKYKDGFSYDSIKSDYEKKVKKPKKKNKLKNTKKDILTVSSFKETDQAIETLNKLPEVEYAVPDDIIEAYEVNQAFDAAASVAIGFENVYELADGAGVTVAVLDTGIKTDLPEFRNRISPGGYDFANSDDTVYDDPVLDAHGTQVAGILAAAAPGVKILPLKFMNGSTGYTSDAIEAIEYAKTCGIKLINCSWGSENNNLALKETIANSDMLFICAGGNMVYGDSNISYPSAFSLPNVISVGAVDAEGKVTDFTNNGTTHALYAPGVNVETISPQGKVQVTGTSYAAPLVTAAAALMLQTAPKLGVELIASCLREGYEKQRYIKLIHAQKAVETVLPYAMLDDSDGRISKLCGMYGGLLPPEVAGLIAKSDTLDDLSDDEKAIVLNCFDLKQTELSGLNHDLVGTLLIGLASKKADITVSAADELYSSYETAATGQGYHKLYSELTLLIEYKKLLTITKAEEAVFLNKMRIGGEAAELFRALIFARATSSSFSDVIGDRLDTDLIQYMEEEEQFRVMEIMQTYKVSAKAVLSTLKNEKSALALSLKLFNWQQEHKISLSDDEQQTQGTVPAYYKSDFGKYKVQTGDVWTYDNFTVDKTDGMASYYQPLVNIPAQGGMNLSFGIRFDPEVADIVSNVKAPGNLGDTCAVNEDRLYYAKIGSSWVRDPSKDQTSIITFITEEDLPYQYTRDGMEVMVDSNCKYIISINNIYSYILDSAAAAAPAAANYYDGIYGLGTAIGTNMPVIETDGACKYLHLGDGRKYEIDSTYSLKGYHLSDMTISPDAASFSANGVVSAYRLSYISGITEYFAADGKYLGKKDLNGNKLEVHYNTDGKISKIIEPSGRYLGFTYINTPSQHTIEIRLNDNPGGNTPAKLLYTITAQQNAAQTGFILDKITNSLGQSSTYSFIEADQAVTINGRSSVFSPISYTNRTIYPHTFYEETGAAITLSYSAANKFYGVSSTRSYPRLTQISRNNGYGTTSFTYQSGTDSAKVNEATAYWMYNDKSLLYKSAGSGYNAMTIGTRKEEYVIDRYGYGLYTRLYQANTLMTQSTQTSYDNYGFPSTSVYAYSNNNSLTLRKFTTYAHDQYGNLTSNGNYASYSTTNGISRTANQFDYTKSRNIPAVTITNIEKDSSGYIKKQVAFHEIDAAHNRITKTSVKAFLDKNNNDRIDAGEDEAPLSETSYRYDQYGNIISTISSEYSKESGGYVKGPETVSNITYDSFYHAYPVQTEIPGIIDADGNSSSIITSSEYDIQGYLTTSYDANGHKTNYEYDAVGNLVKTNYYEKVNGIQTLRYTDQTAYDYPNRKITAKPFMGPWTETTYDVYGNVVTVRESVNKGVTWMNVREETYNTLLQNTSSKQYTTNGEYILVSRTFNWQNQITSEITKAYNTNNTLKEQLSHVENTYEYVGSNDLVTTVTKDAAGKILTKSQTQSNNFGVINVKTWDDVSAVEPQYTDYTDYGEYGVIKRTYGESTIDTDYKYDIAGRQNETVTGSTPDGVTQYTGYGMVHKSVTETNRQKGLAEGDEYKYASLYSYDKLGRQILVQDPFEMNGDEISYAENKIYYDNAGNVIKTMTKTNKTGANETWSTTEYTYDWRGLLIKTRQVADFSFQDIYTQYLYNAAGLKVKEYSGMNAPLEIDWHFDSDGNVVVDSEISSSVSETSYEYDTKGNLVKYTDPLGKSDEMAYNELGQLTYKRLRNGKAFKYTYSASGQLATEQAGTATGTFSKGTFTGSFTQAGSNKVTYTYDSSDNLQRMVDTIGTWSYTHDAVGRVLTETMPGGYRATRTYVDKLKTDYVLTSTTQEKTYVKQRYTHDDKGRLTVITNETEAGETYGIWYTYDAFNQLRNRSYSYGRGAVFQNPTSVQGFSYNLAGLTEQITGYTNETYTYYLDGKTAAVTTDGVAGVYYSYDKLGRLLNETEQNSSGTVTRNCTYMVYDARGNCIKKQETKGNNSPIDYYNYSYDKANRMIGESWTINQQTSTQNYTYDDSGNLLTEGGTKYTYDAWNRTANIGTTTFTYDGLGRRFSKTYNGVTKQHIWDGDEIIYDTDSASTYIHGLFAEGTLRGGRLSGYTLYLNMVNARGDVTGIRAINTYGGNVDWGGMKYDAYGNVKENTTSSSVTPYGYSGEYTDESGLQYLRARYYDPRTGRFTQEDTWVDQGPNLYTYCGNDPVNNADPSGHCYGFPSVVTWEGIEYVANMRGPSGQRRTVTGVGLECSEVPGGWIHYIIAEDAGPYCLERIKHKAMFEATISNPNTNEAALPFPGGLDIGAALGAFGSAVGTALAGGIGASATALGALVSLFPFLLTGSSAQTQSGPVSVALTDAKSLDTIKNHSGFYFGAALIGEEKKWTIVTPPMTRETAISWAQISAASAYISESGMNLYTNTSWGLYCPSHLEAYSLAAMFSGGNFPVGPEVYGKGEFMHYHTAKPSKFMGRYRHFHFWFGFPVF